LATFATVNKKAGCSTVGSAPRSGRGGRKFESSYPDYLLSLYEEIKKDRLQEGKQMPEITFEWRYDLQSFFNYFSVLNVSELARKSGINASLLRQYRNGLAKASESQYDKIRKCIHQIGHELETARF
jgi:hypothetical protein